MDELLTTKAAASLLHLQPHTLRCWRFQGRGPKFIRLGDSPAARVVYRREELLEYLAAREFSSTAEESAAAARKASCSNSTSS